MITLRPLMLLFALMFGMSAAGAAERRVALVVGASAYRAVPALVNTLNDANNIAAALKRLQFDVETVLDPDRAAFETAVRRLGDRARGADIALFFYAGHAVEANGQNWLLPVSSDPHDARDLRFEAIELDALLEQLAGGPRLAVIILDSCRDNPFRMRFGDSGRGIALRGLAQVQAAAGTLVVFSTAPGTVAADGNGPDSPFTTALLKYIETPGQDIHEMLANVRRDVREATNGQQIPWEQSAMEGTLYLRSPPEVRSVVAPAPGAAAGAETLFWDTVRNSTTPSELQAYLDRFPNGVFAELARARLAALNAAPAADVAAKLIAARPIPSAAKWEDAVRRYAQAHTHKAFAALPEQDALFWSADWGSLVRAEALTLERCQLAHGAPCRLIALDNEVRSDPQPRDMPRLHYDGQIRVTEIPAIADRARANPAVADYPTATGPKAMVIFPLGAIYPVTGAATQRAAEEQALAQCSAEHPRGVLPCLLYAVGNQVVIGQRRTTPLTLATPARGR